ncbi:MAG: DUF2769 domain-containing protein [ANME-2 cluster archaeon]|nr:DUF2769 domain-containing protein [ANME-2 cluster archaeon]
MPVDDTKENLAICMNYCGTCPSLPYPQQPMLFCARGKSPEKIVKKGCKCPACMVYARYKLKDMYFCDIGKAP